MVASSWVFLSVRVRAREPTTALCWALSWLPSHRINVIRQAIEMKMLHAAELGPVAIPVIIIFFSS